MAQAQLFGKGNELHLGFVLVGAACCLKELPWGGSSVSVLGGGPQTPCGTLGMATPSPATSALQSQAQMVPTPVKAQHRTGPHLVSQVWRQDGIIFCVQDEERAGQHLHTVCSKHSTEESPWS